MGSSIQEFLKKINSRLSVFDCVSIFITASVCAIFTVFIVTETNKSALPITYVKGAAVEENRDIRPFGTRNGTTYTFSWCQGGNTIKPENMVYFSSEAEAVRLGRTLSKLCLR